MKIILEIRRYNPESDETPYDQRYEVDVAPTARVLDALVQVKQFQDGTLTFRKSCAHGVCGSDAMVINGRERLACKTLVQEVAQEHGALVRIDPLRGFRVERDVLVDQTPFLKKYQSIKPYLINDQRVGEKEQLQTPEERIRIDDATSCILCCGCFSACPVLQEGTDFLGPAIISQASRFLDDSRDRGFEDRLPVLDSPDGVWPCENHFECTRMCPRGVKITKRINETKRRVEKYRQERGESVNDGT
jgi:succinate dehydrogenase / fumarate reductase iron-sulfur subunit